MQDRAARKATFTLSIKQWRAFVTVGQAAQAMQARESQHIQVLLDLALGHIPEMAGTRYICGCAGLADLARGSLNRPSIEQFLGCFQMPLGRRLVCVRAASSLFSISSDCQCAAPGCTGFQGRCLLVICNECS